MRAAKTSTDIRQDQIATAALELMARHGPKALNLAALARRVGVVPSAIYRHYPGKEAVLEAVLDLIAQRLQANVQAVRQETPQALERLRRLLNRHIQLIQGHAAIPRVVLSEEIFDGHTKRRHRVYSIIQAYLGEVADLIREGQRQGGLRADIPADTASVMFLGLIHPAVILWLTSDGAFDIATHAEQAWLLFSRMLQPPAERAAGSSRFPGRPGPGKRNSKHRRNKHWR